MPAAYFGVEREPAQAGLELGFVRIRVRHATGELIRARPLDHDQRAERIGVAHRVELHRLELRGPARKLDSLARRHFAADALREIVRLATVSSSGLMTYG